MSDKFSMQELIGLLAKRHDMQQADADVFVKTLFALIGEALASDKYVKVKGLGTFKLIDVDKRESVDVNTGERIEIQGHSKIVFLPDLKMRDVVNKPFSHFETVLLNENVRFDDMAEENKSNELSVEGKAEIIEDDSDEGVAEEVQCASSVVTDLSERNTEIIDSEESFEDNSDDIKCGTGNHWYGLGIPAVLILTTLFLGIIIGGGVVWLTLSRQQMLQKHPEPTALEKSKSGIDDAIELDNVSPLTDSVALAVNAVPESFVAKDKAVAIPQTPETLADTLEYRIVGTRTSYTIKEGESLVRVSLKFYGTKKLWTYIARYNRELLKDADCVPVGTVLRVPELIPK